jgi:predicted acetyltransferase
MKMNTLAPIDPGQLRESELELRFKAFMPHPVHKVTTYYFQMVHVGTGDELRIINLRVGSTPHIELYAGHVGYAVHPPHRGHRFAARSLRLLLPLARSLSLNPLWVTCDPENAASRRSLEIVGARLIEIVDVPAHCVIHQSGHPRKCRYRLGASGAQFLREHVASNRSCTEPGAGSRRIGVGQSNFDGRIAS